MWELIRANKIKSAWLVFCMALVLFALGFVIGEAMAPGGGLVGLLLGFIIWAAMSLTSYYAGDSIVLAVSQAREIKQEDHPRLFNVVEEMKIASGLPMPRVFIIDDESPNAFATGRSPKTACVAVTSGLLNRLNRDELQGVIAHEMGHILNRDILFMMLMGTLAGAVVLIADLFLWSMWFGRGGSRFRTKRGGGQAQAIFIIVAIIFALLAPLIARMIYFASSRRREYLADATAARLTRYPEGLASALEKIAGNRRLLLSANKAFAPMYIINPIRSAGLKAANATSTHPPINERVKILRTMVHGASYADYEKACRQSRLNRRGSGLPVGLVGTGEKVDIRAASKEPDSKLKKVRETTDLLRRINNFLFLVCVCGLKIKVPPDFKEEKIACPRCKKEHVIPVAHLATIAALGTGLDKVMPGTKPSAKAEKRLEYKRKGRDWESFRCPCGHPQQLSPLFSAPAKECSKCHARINILPAFAGTE